MQEWLKTLDLCRYYRRASHEVRAVDRVSISIERGEFLAVVGSSGSGKSTLLNLLAGLDTPTAGYVEYNSIRLDSLDRSALAAYRARSVGMVFQSFNLISHQTALRNVELALYFTDVARRDRRRQATEMLDRLGLADRLDHRPADLSGGEQQRVALARALVKKPEVLYADEPTGNLDFENTEQIAALLQELNKGGLTVVMVTHDRELAEKCADRTEHMHYGQVVDGGAEATGEITS